MPDNRDFLAGYYSAIELLEDMSFCDSAYRTCVRYLLEHAPDNGQRLTFTIDSAAAWLGVSRRSLERAVASGLIQGQMYGGRLRFAEAELERFQELPKRKPGRRKRELEEAS